VTDTRDLKREIVAWPNVALQTVVSVSIAKLSKYFSFPWQARQNYFIIFFSMALLLRMICTVKKFTTRTLN